jgi:hypothetical protein
MKDTRNVDQLKADIDSGKTGDKISWPDPAMAPLGTDDEAAGTPPTPDQVRAASRQETGAGATSADGKGLGPSWWLIAITILIGLTILAAPFFLR